MGFFYYYLCDFFFNTYSSASTMSPRSFNWLSPSGRGLNLAIQGGLSGLAPSRAPFTVRSLKDLKPWDPSTSGGEVELGRGVNGTVHLHRHATTNQPVAIKVFTLPPTDLQRLQVIYNIREEAKYLNRFGEYRYFPSYLGCLEIDANKVGIAMEFVGDEVHGESTTIRKVLETGQPQLSPEDLFDIINDILDGFYNLHLHCTLINDFKDDNVLIYKDQGKWHGKIIDFGHASSITDPLEYTFTQNEKDAYRTRGLYCHIAPELVLDGEAATRASDVFQIGFVLRLLADHFKIDTLRDIAEACSAHDPGDRPLLIDIIRRVRALQATTNPTH